MRLAHAFAASAVLALSACGGGGQSQDNTSASPAASPAAVADATTATSSTPAVFAQCAACHTVKQGVNAIGPSLFGVVGRKAGSLAGYAYSDALKASGKTWDEASLDVWLTNPMKDVPGTKMTFAGLADPAKRQELIAFLKTQK